MRERPIPGTVQSLKRSLFWKGFFRPFGACSVPLAYLRLAPGAAFFRRYCDWSRDMFSSGLSADDFLFHNDGAGAAGRAFDAVAKLADVDFQLGDGAA